METHEDKSFKWMWLSFFLPWKHFWWLRNSMCGCVQQKFAYVCMHTLHTLTQTCSNEYLTGFNFWQATSNWIHSSLWHAHIWHACPGSWHDICILLEWKMKWFFFSCPEKLNFMEGFSPLGSCVRSITSSMSSCQNYYQGFRVLLLALKFSINTNIRITFHLNSTSTSVRAATSAKQTQRSMSIVQELHNCYRNLHELLLKIKKHRDLFSLCVLYWLERSWDFKKL